MAQWFELPDDASLLGAWETGTASPHSTRLPPPIRHGPRSRATAPRPPHDAHTSVKRLPPARNSKTQAHSFRSSFMFRDTEQLVKASSNDMPAWLVRCTASSTLGAESNTVCGLCSNKVVRPHPSAVVVQGPLQQFCRTADALMDLQLHYMRGQARRIRFLRCHPCGTMVGARNCRKPRWQLARAHSPEAAASTAGAVHMSWTRGAFPK